MTKGPWKLETSNLFVPDEGKQRDIYVITSVKGRWIEAGYIDSKEDLDNAQAKALLPELVEAARGLVTSFDMAPTAQSDRLRSVLDKIGGER